MKLITKLHNCHWDTNLWWRCSRLPRSGISGSLRIQHLGQLVRISRMWGDCSGRIVQARTPWGTLVYLKKVKEVVTNWFGLWLLLVSAKYLLMIQNPSRHNQDNLFRNQKVAILLWPSPTKKFTVFYPKARSHWISGTSKSANTGHEKLIYATLKHNWLAFRALATKAI